MWPQMVFLVIAIIAVALLALIAMVIGGKRRHTFDVQAYQTKWLKIENNLVKDDKRSYNLSVLEADKLFDKALNEMGVPGQTMGEKLKKLDHNLPEVKKIWYAHRLRNRIAHESEFQVNYDEARSALRIFRQALKNIGAI